VNVSPACNFTWLFGFALLYSSITVYCALFAAIGANVSPAEAKSSKFLIFSFSFFNTIPVLLKPINSLGK
jgi:hypothetical protein